MSKASFTLETLITIIGVFIIFAITLSGKIDLVWVLIILGFICLLHGIVTLTKKHIRQPKSQGPSSIHKCLLQIILGGFILMLSSFPIYHKPLYEIPFLLTFAFTGVIKL